MFPMPHAIPLINNKYLLVTPDGSCYYSINSSDNYISYDSSHVNASFRSVVINRYISNTSYEELVCAYSDALSMPW
jgi:hypothetical protein